MLPDFLIQLPALDSQVRARDLPTGAFFCGFPDDVPFSDCYRAADWTYQQAINIGLERWVTDLLTRAVIDPVLDAGWVHRMGPSRDVLARTYLETIGWLTPDPDTSIPAELAAPGETLAPPLPLAALTSLPSKNLRGLLKQMATRMRRLPSELWALPVSEWMLNMQCLADPQPDDEFKRALGIDY